MSSFLKKAFGWIGGGGEEGGSPSATASGEPETYRDCVITATPMKEGSQWRLAGSISREIGGERYERTFIRADLFASEEEARSFTIRKAQQIIDQNPALFSGDKSGTA